MATATTALVTVRLPCCLRPLQLSVPVLDCCAPAVDLGHVRTTVRLHIRLCPHA